MSEILSKFLGANTSLYDYSDEELIFIFMALSYGYYEMDAPLTSDEIFDVLTNHMLLNNIFNESVTIHHLRSGTGHDLVYPEEILELEVFK